MKQVQTKDLYSIAQNGYKTLGLSVGRQRVLLVSIRRLVKYLNLKGISQYSVQNGDDFITHSVIEGKHCTLNHRRALDLLNNIIEGKGYEGRKKKVYSFPGEIGKESQTYIVQVEQESRLMPGTIRQIKGVLSDFSSSMNTKGFSFNDINRDAILQFISSLHNHDPHIISILRRFCSYLFQKGLINEDFSDVLSGFSKPPVKLPSVYNAEEIRAVEKAAKRTTPVGKRDYAMLLLASRLGLRASDIANLEFSSLDWRKSTLSLTQEKTKHPIELPLTNDVGMAIIDYLQNARPQSDSQKVFLTVTSPFRPISKNCVSRAVGLAFSISGINTKERHHSAHSLRHSLATEILRNNTKLPVITEVLGHTSSESTMVYLGVNIDLLLRCSLSIPSVDEDFYNQEGGWFYDK